ncbi:MAG: SAM-dependent methyltransferase [Dehalococcoidia bacterium]|nr:SAM-dependent methyltransferase [Dehalococcoidia bacterium]
MDLERARYLVSSAGVAALAALQEEVVPAGLVAQSGYLRKQFPPAEAAALGEQLTLQERARHRHGDLVQPFLYTDAGLQMMTHPLVAARRAARLAAPGTAIVDATCGLGGDLQVLASVGTVALGLERDHATALLASANLAGRAHIALGDAESLPVRPGGRALFIDPSRRGEFQRHFDPASFSPDWDSCLRLAKEATIAAVKTAPGIPESALPPEAEVEFVQLGRSLREATLWFGEDAQAGLRRAVMLPSGAEMTSREPDAVPTSRPAGRYLLDPAGCVTRAGLVRQLAARVGGGLMDEKIAYIALDALVPTSFGTTLEVLEDLPFSVSRVRALLHQQGWKPDEIRRRGFPIEPDELRRLLRPRGDIAVTLVCTTIAGKRRIFVCRPAQVDGTAGQ